MKPMFQWMLWLENEGYNEPVPGRSVSKVGTPLRGYGPSLNDPAETNAFDYPLAVYGNWSGIVITATRTATATIARGESESEEAAAIRAEQAAIDALGDWVDEDPHSVGTPGADSSGGYDYSEDGVAYYTGTANESKFQIRVAPPYSGRVNLRYATWVYDGDTSTSTEYDVQQNVPAGVSYMGIPRCIPLPFADPLTDAHWIYMLESPVTLSAGLGLSRWAEIIFANSYRAPAP